MSNDIFKNQYMNTRLSCLTQDTDFMIKSVAHRGFSSEAPENTLAAFRLAKLKGYHYVESDVRFTKDNIPVMIHDTTINRTSNCTVPTGVSTSTYEELRQYDYGSWKGAKYAGERIPNFKEFLRLCKSINLCPHIELKDAHFTKQQINSLVETVRLYGLEGKVSWIAFDSTYLEMVYNANKNSRIGFLHCFANGNLVEALEIKEAGGNVFFDVNYTEIKNNQNGFDFCKEHNIPVEVWTLDNKEDLFKLDPYITGITSNKLIAGEELYLKYLEV